MPNARIWPRVPRRRQGQRAANGCGIIDPSMKLRVLPVTAVLVARAVAAMLPALWSRSGRPGKYSQKMVILGFDGMDPDLVQQFVADRKLPNIKRLIDQGGLYSLGTTYSAESPTA